jgi:pimeloyl-ACP methyl ester carboxylesterase
MVITLDMSHATPLLLLPGLMNDARIWNPLTAAIAGERTAHVAPTHLHDSIAESARDAIAAMPAGSFAVAGFSLGGYVAQEVCRQAGRRIAGLGLLDTGARADTEEAKQARERMIQAVDGAEDAGTAAFVQVAQGFAARIVHASRLQDRELLHLLFDMASAVGSRGFVRQQRAAMNRVDTRDLLPRLHVPTVVVCGREDQVTPFSLSQEMASLLPDAELVAVAEAGHMSILEQPAAVVAALVRWLRRVDAATARHGQSPASGDAKSAPRPEGYSSAWQG